MYLLGLGIILLLLKYFEISPVAQWSWWLVLVPFAAAIVWWAWADWSGYTKRKAMDRHDVRKQQRIDRQRKAIGQPTASSKRRRN
ncbi:TIGR04438 family Trp-rich protein [Ottowia thiooxydans]|uniref:TIGR04438 family Trp-rich protein n=1 Tax=Ottowia thiooxydans TaxID=219182 RepID=UPI00042488E9|nr:TIGR04438 family Trp-rich protein [Ottowia thiooxydans]